MTDLKKHRKYCLIAMITMTVAFLLSFATLWNSLLSAGVKHEGWVIVFMLLTFLSGSFISFIAYKNTNAVELDKIKKTAHESGKNEVLQELENRTRVESKDQKVEEEDIDKSVEIILKGLKGARTGSGLCNKILTNLANQMGFVQGIMYLKEAKGEMFTPEGEYAFTGQKLQSFRKGENLTGQVAESKSLMILYDVPENYFAVTSGLGSSQPHFLLIVPVLSNGETIAVLELAAFKKPDEITGKILTKLSSELGNRLNKFAAA